MAETPKPRSIAQRLIMLCEKLWHFGDDALDQAKEAQSPLRARDYSSSGSKGKGEIDDRTGDTAVARSERKGVSLYQRLVNSLNDLDRAARTANLVIDAVFHTPDPKDAKRKLRKAGSGDCTACGDYVPGIEEDRIKAGLCPAHYRGWLRAQKEGVTRADYIDQVKRDLRRQP